MKQIEQDFEADGEPLITSRRRVQPHNEVYLRNPAIGGESSDEEDEGVRRKLEREGMSKIFP
jgi:hypothetical protein